jgi:hypothetical protein
MLRRSALPLLVATAAICALPAGAAGATGPDLEVQALPDPVPSGQAGSYGLRLRAIVVNAGGRPARASQIRFALSANGRLGEADTLLPAMRTEALKPGRRDAVTQEWQVPPSVDAGIYHVLACADVADAVTESDESDNCRAAEETVAIPASGGETTAQAGAPMPGAVAAGPPKEEHFPEREPYMTVGPGFDCPASAHGQGRGRCVWVKTPSMPYDPFKPEVGRIRSDIWYCPDGYGYPFEVALGFDPMWESLGFNSDAFIETVASKKWTLYRNIFGREYYPSYGAPSEHRGYVVIDFNGAARGLFSANPWRHEARYLCSDTLANSMLP